MAEHVLTEQEYRKSVSDSKTVQTLTKKIKELEAQIKNKSVTIITKKISEEHIFLRQKKLSVDEMQHIQAHLQTMLMYGALGSSDIEKARHVLGMLFDIKKVPVSEHVEIQTVGENDVDKIINRNTKNIQSENDKLKNEVKLLKQEVDRKITEKVEVVDNLKEDLREQRQLISTQRSEINRQSELITAKDNRKINFGLKWFSIGVVVSIAINLLFF